eukprot:CAMPEP_0171681024 /NCGR_PEP_ID=MMETSP0990-20121206/57147_1 /TAXON_ID=483369 /ORGANISM="non described non described, Strain CCMP2098" /LENGTH=181 /DNA_ID=CAMNT_0012268043 /DNA_START=279 /DNA_END=822 /DNA_ORIENTATION=-
MGNFNPAAYNNSQAAAASAKVSSSSWLIFAAFEFLLALALCHELGAALLRGIDLHGYHVEVLRGAVLAHVHARVFDFVVHAQQPEALEPPKHADGARRSPREVGQEEHDVGGQHRAAAAEFRAGAVVAHAVVVRGGEEPCHDDAVEPAKPVHGDRVDHVVDGARAPVPVGAETHHALQLAA